MFFLTLLLLFDVYYLAAKSRFFSREGGKNRGRVLFEGFSCKGSRPLFAIIQIFALVFGETNKADFLKANFFLKKKIIIKNKKIIIKNKKIK